MYFDNINKIDLVGIVPTNLEQQYKMIFYEHQCAIQTSEP